MVSGILEGEGSVAEGKEGNGGSEGVEEGGLGTPGVEEGLVGAALHEGVLDDDGGMGDGLALASDLEGEGGVVGAVGGLVFDEDGGGVDAEEFDEDVAEDGGFGAAGGGDGVVEGMRGDGVAEVLGGMAGATYDEEGFGKAAMEGVRGELSESGGGDAAHEDEAVCLTDATVGEEGIGGEGGEVAPGQETDDVVEGMDVVGHGLRGVGFHATGKARWFI
jgi:hypothetical protein